MRQQINIREHFWRGNATLPDIVVEAGFLFGRDMLTLEVAVGPPADPFVVKLHGFSEELVAVAGQGVAIDGSHAHGPEASSACLASA